MLTQGFLATVQPISVHIDNIVLYQNEILKVLSIDKSIVTLERLSNGTVIQLPYVVLKVII